MPYVALSRVRTIHGRHLLAFEADSISCDPRHVTEHNRLCQAFWPHIPVFEIPKRRRRRKVVASHAMDEGELGRHSTGTAPQKKGNKSEMHVRLLVSDRWKAPAEKESPLPSQRLSRASRNEGQDSRKHLRPIKPIASACG